MAWEEHQKLLLANQKSIATAVRMAYGLGKREWKKYLKTKV